ncbi:TPA: methyl-accepting chemotaxis protein [Aeromonas salmonicida]|uniref:Hemolysin secretion protein HylB n=2 Tax=Aeromonas salmonicida subsp. salmonicida TaxID=29491 RepID=A4SI81_AERS4|nr:methyl-accepting chemotaxis protein [Aeromonas salmonicida]ABO88603.1 hemolysin secretion protein HylB [Aeromonas salmonicida subsp. salmonicida A449]AYO61760.1 methyl-accepting chemotaxis protein [Aeromonas salmonicida subsp. salmonicida 01-B526]EHI52740.1 hemolysin secretion protein HylB [Aeromonas salmonicida subsp. salmonicida 01-B526]EKP0240183.1 methyl-accepting chemotaxis protein [Aeromonas salmonicida]EKP0244365.1 methyl-accepting chemotaxis protein [Aeromonas salmonicida]
MLEGKLTLKLQLILAVTVPCLALLLVGGASLRSMGSIQQQSTELYQNTATPMRAMAEVVSRIPRMRVGIDMMLLQDTSLKDERGVLSRVKDARDEDIPEMRQAMQQAVTAQTDPAARADAQKLLSQFEGMERNELNPMLQALEKGDMEAARGIYRDRYTVTYGTMRKDANTLLDGLIQQAQQRHQRGEQSYASGRMQMITIISGAILISLLVSVLILINLKRRVGFLQQYIGYAAEHLALDSRAKLTGNDELAEITESFNHFVSKIHSAIEQVARNSHQLAATADEVASKAQLTQQNCTAQRDRTVQVATATEEQSSVVGELNRNVEDINQLTMETADIAHQLTDASRSLQQLSGELDKLVGNFRL